MTGGRRCGGLARLTSCRSRPLARVRFPSSLRGGCDHGRDQSANGCTPQSLRTALTCTDTAIDVAGRSDCMSPLTLTEV